MLTYSPFLRNTDSVDTSRLIISTCHFPTAARVALDIIGRRLLQLFHHTNTSGFILCLWNVESKHLLSSYYFYSFSHRLWKLGRATHSSRKKNKEKVKNRFYLDGGFWKLVSGYYMPANVITSHIPRKS